MSNKIILKIAVAGLCFSVFTLLFSSFNKSSVMFASSPNGPDVKVKRILSYENSGSKKTAIDEVELDVDESLPLQGHPEERLYYFLDGRGIMSIYEEFPKGDVYELRQDIAIYMTPGIKHEIMNICISAFIE